MTSLVDLTFVAKIIISVIQNGLTQVSCCNLGISVSRFVSAYGSNLGNVILKSAILRISMLIVRMFCKF